MDKRINPDELPSFRGLRKKNLEALYGRNRKDKSPKGSVDDHIKALVDSINGHESYVTLSSCSGRICVYDPTSSSDQLHDPEIGEDRASSTNGGWLLVSHDEIELGDLTKCIAEHTMTGHACFRFEPFLLHVAAESLSAGKELLQVALRTGLRESGLVVTTDRVTVALRTVSLQLTVPIVNDLPVSYLKKLVSEANERLRKNWTTLCRLQVAFDSLCATIPLVVCCLPNLNIYGSAAAYDPTEDRIMAFGGYGSGPNWETPSRSNKLYALSLSDNSVWKSIDIGRADLKTHGQFVEWSARQGAAITRWRGAILVHGGRCGHALGDLYLYQDGYLVSPTTVTGEVPSARWGHTITALSSDTFLLVGGRSSGRLAEDSIYLLYLLNLDNIVWKRIHSEEKEFCQFHHAAVSLGERRVFVFGGLQAVDCLDPHNKALVVQLESDDSIVCTAVDIGSLVGRFGHQLNVISSTVSRLFRILLSGGISNCREECGSYIDTTFVWLTLVLDELDVSLIAVPLETSDSCGALVHHTAVSTDNEIETVYMIGGGCQGFAFRDIYAKSLKLEFGYFKATNHSDDVFPEATDRSRYVSAVETDRSRHVRAVETNLTKTSPCPVVYGCKQTAKVLKTFLESSGQLSKDFKMCQVDIAGVQICANDNVDWTACIALPVTDFFVEHDLIIGRGKQACPQSSKSYAPRFVLKQKPHRKWDLPDR